MWIGLAALVAAPFPLPIDWTRFTGLAPGIPWPFLERGVPILFLVAAGVLVALAAVARASWPFAALILWAGLRAGYHSFPPRSVVLMGLLLMAGLLYVAAREMPDRLARIAGWAFLAGAGWEVLFGALNAAGFYPWMAWVSKEHMGKPMGFLSHPNYWGSYVAMALPLAWSRLGLFAVAPMAVLLVRTLSGGPVISAAVGALVMAWPLFGARVRLLVIGLGASAVTVVMTLHEWRLSGRREVWSLVLSGEIWKWPFMGQGLGEWRIWAEEYNESVRKEFVTLLAHNEPLQLWFELGLIGVGLAALWMWQAGQAGWTVWRAAPAGRIPGPWWAFGRAPLERAWVAVLAVAAVNMLGSPTFHLPGQAALALFALARVQADAAALRDRRGEDHAEGRNRGRGAAVRRAAARGNRHPAGKADRAGPGRVPGVHGEQVRGPSGPPSGDPRRGGGALEGGV